MPVPNPLTLPLDDLQGWVVRGYHLPFGLHLFLTFASGDRARSWLRTNTGQVTTAAPWPDNFKPSSTLNVAFTFAGLRTLGASEVDLAAFPDEFRAGMAARADRLGDVGGGAPGAWEIGRPDQLVHALVTVHATTEDARAQRLADLRAGFGPGVQELFAQPTALLPGEVEHFGFRDGLSQPPIEGSGIPMYPGHGVPLADGSWRGLKAGELILGHADEAGLVSPLPAALAHNGTFLVLRKMRQHVEVFRQYLRETADRLYGSPAAANVERLAAKLVGRWRSGAPIELAPLADAPALATAWETNNDFRYGQDPVGTTCPRGAHVRRTNPRDALDGQDVAVQRHRLVRRGMPYGTWLPDGSPDDEPGRGLVFIALNADIGRQFEFVQTDWIDKGSFADLGSNDRDPVVGSNDLPGSGSYLIPGASPPFLSGLPRFTTTRGGGYFFVPGIAALQSLVNP